MENANFTPAYRIFLKYCHNHHIPQKFPLQLLPNTANLNCMHGYNTEMCLKGIWKTTYVIAESF